MTEKHKRIADNIFSTYEKTQKCEGHEFKFDKKRTRYFCKKCGAFKTPLQYAIWMKGGEAE